MEAYVREIGVFVGNLNLRRKSITSTGTNIFIPDVSTTFKVSSSVVYKMRIKIKLIR